MSTLLAALFCLCAVMQVYQTGVGRYAVDFYQHWAVVHAVRERLVPSVYTVEGQQALGRIFAERAARPDASELERGALHTNLDFYKGKLQTVGTPALYAAMSPFVSDDYDVDRKTFFLAQIGAIVAASLLFGTAVGLPAWIALLLAAWGVWFFEPAISDLVVGSVSSFQWMGLGVVVVIARTERNAWRDAVVGAALGLATATKPNLLLVVATVLLPLAVGRRTGALVRTAGGAVAGAALGVAGSAAWFGTPSAWGEWAKELPLVANVTAGLDDGNMGLVALLHQTTHHNLSRPLLFAVAIVIVAVVWRRRREGGPRQDELLFAIAVGGAATALVAPIFWLHYGLLVVPAALVCWRFGGRGAKWGTLVAMMLMSSVPRMVDGDVTRFAAGVAIAQLSLFGMALTAWVRAERTFPAPGS